MIMRVKVIEVIYRFFGSPKQEVLKDDDIDLTVYPVKDDRVYIDDVQYRVIQRDLFLRKDPNNQKMILFVEKTY